MTLRRLTILHDYHLLTSWDHTAMICCMVNNLQATLINVNTEKGKRTQKPKNPVDFHPYRHSQKVTGMKITKENFKQLKTFGNMICRGS